MRAHIALYIIALVHVLLFADVRFAEGALFSAARPTMRSSSSGSSALSTKKQDAMQTNKKRKPKSALHFIQCALAGAISCSTTHSLMVPLDVIKTKIQTDATFKELSVMAAFNKIVRGARGKRALIQGLAATASGYFLQGFAKFGFYELFKINIADKMEKDGLWTEAARLPVFIASAGLAEIIASLVLCPMEVTKIHMMLNPTAGKQMFAVMRQIVVEGGPAALFRGLPLIMLRQIPYTCVKLTGYDMMVEKIRGAKKVLLEKMKLTDERKIGDDVEVQLLSGVLAGVLAACISQPADVMLSKMCGGTRALSECIIVDGPFAFLRMFQDLGLKGCFEGLQPRAIMIGTMTASQFVVYEQTRKQIKKLCGTPSSYLPDTAVGTNAHRSKSSAAAKGERGKGGGEDAKKKKEMVPVAAQQKSLFSSVPFISSGAKKSSSEIQQEKTMDTKKKRVPVLSRSEKLGQYREVEREVFAYFMEELDKEYGKRPRPKLSASFRVM